jgi:hypothetical protein
MRQCVIRIITAAAAMVTADFASATCLPAQLTGAWTLVGNFGSGGTSMSSFRCSSFNFNSGGGNKYSVTGACTWFAAGVGTIAYSPSGTATILVNTTSCKGSGSFTFTHGAVLDFVTIRLLQFANPGNGTARMGQATVDIGPNNFSLDFTLMR